MPKPPSKRRSPANAEIPATPKLRDALEADFTVNGPDAVAQLREADPVAYLRLCGELLTDGGDTRDGDDAALVARVRALLADIGAVAGGPDD